jgi:hypothetical protein
MKEVFIEFRLLSPNTFSLTLGRYIEDIFTNLKFLTLLIKIRAASGFGGRGLVTISERRILKLIVTFFVLFLFTSAMSNVYASNPVEVLESKESPSNLPLGTGLALTSASDELPFDSAQNQIINQSINNERISTHKLTLTELQKLKEKFGVAQPNQNYNRIISGHGTGLRPPTEDEWVEVLSNSYTVENVVLDSTIQAPSSVDLTTTPWFPPIGDQGSQGSCVAWAVGYYTKTYQEAKEHSWVVSAGPSDKITSPSFIYNLINGGVDSGSWYSDAIGLICSVGAF